MCQEKYEGGGLASIENSVDTWIIALEDYIKTTEEKLFPWPETI